MKLLNIFSIRCSLFIVGCSEYLKTNSFLLSFCWLMTALHLFGFDHGKNVIVLFSLTSAFKCYTEYDDLHKHHLANLE